MSPFQGASVRESVRLCGYRRDTSEWGEIWHKRGPLLPSHAGVGSDDTHDTGALVADTQNRLVLADTMYDITQKLTMSLEVSQATTSQMEKLVGQRPTQQLHPTEPGESWVFDRMCTSAFKQAGSLQRGDGLLGREDADSCETMMIL